MGEKDTTRERYEGDTQERSWDANVKRTYDEMQSISLASQQRSQDHYDELKQLSIQALQNAIETANQVGKNSLNQSHQAQMDRQRHVDFAVDRQWAGTDVSQGAQDVMTARAVTIDDASLKAIGAVVAASLAEALGKK